MSLINNTRMHIDIAESERASILRVELKTSAIVEVASETNGAFRAISE